MKDSYVSLRINRELKEKVHKIFDEYNMSVSEGIRYLYQRIEGNPTLLSKKNLEVRNEKK